MKKLSEILTVIDENEDFIYLEVADYTKDENRRVLVMNGFDGRETFIRVSKVGKDNSLRTEFITLWYSGRTPENTITYTFGECYSAYPLVRHWYCKLKTALEEMGVSCIQ